MRIAMLLTLGTRLWCQEVGVTPAGQFEEERLQQLLQVRRIYIDKLVGSSAEQIRNMLMSSLQGAKIFVVTENAEKADAVLRGTAEDLIYTDVFQSSESVNARGSSNSTRGTGSTRQGLYSGLGAGETENSRSSERRHEAGASLRLVNKDGDVIWSTIQESRGAKFRSAAADVVDKVSRQLAQDYEKARKGKGVPPPAAAVPPASK